MGPTLLLNVALVAILAAAAVTLHWRYKAAQARWAKRKKEKA